VILADTHLVVALVRPRDPDRAREIALVAERSAESGEPLVVAESVLAETVWVLRSSYGMSPADAAAVLRRALSTQALVPWDEELAFTALDLMAADPALDITDCILAAMSTLRGAAVATLDRRLLRALGGD
jgi:predicted nucleic acid-binding protein